jgi:hypothetical protein
MRILIGYSMRSGSTLLQHMLDGHSALRSLSDLSSIAALAQLAAGIRLSGNLCVKPMDLLYLQRTFDFYRRFDRFVWLTRDPRDSYLSAVESGYAYLFWPRGRMEAGIDTGLLERWRRIYCHYFDHPDRWYRVRYEDLVQAPEPSLRALLSYLDLPYERLHPFSRFRLRHGGDYKITRHRDIREGSRQRHERELSSEQRAVFERHMGSEMQALGYLDRNEPSLRARPVKRATQTLPIPTTAFSRKAFRGALPRSVTI